MKELGNCIESIPYKSGLFGKKPTSIDIYEKGLILNYKSAPHAYAYAEISAMKSPDYFAPNPVMYNLDLVGADAKKIVSLAFPYAQRDTVTKLLLAHGNALKGPGFPGKLMESKYILDDSTTWDNGTLYRKWKKGTEHYTPDQIDQFIEKNGTYFFSLKTARNPLLSRCIFHPTVC